MKVEYDQESDAAYIYLKHPLKERGYKKTLEVHENIFLDLDEKGKILPCYWRMLYTLTRDESELEIIAFVIEICDHKEYDKQLGYKN